MLVTSENTMKFGHQQKYKPGFKPMLVYAVFFIRDGSKPWPLADCTHTDIHTDKHGSIHPSYAHTHSITLGS